MAFLHRRLAYAGSLALLLLGACATEAPAPDPVPVAMPVPPPDPEVEAQAVPPVRLNLPEAPPARAAPAKPTAKPVARAPQSAAPTAPTAPPPEVRSAPLPSPTPKPVAAAQNGPVWMKGCVRRTQAGGAIQCDADFLLTQPSAKVRVFTREPGLARPVSEGQAIQLREGLPLRYRFFVLP